MRATERLLVQIDKPDQIHATRRELYLRLRRALEVQRTCLDRWQAYHFANAIQALAMNVNSLVQPCQSWLRLCLSDFRLAFLPPSARRNAIERTLLQGITTLHDYDQLMAELDTIASKL